MGNKLGLKRQVVDDKYTKPQGLYELKDVDQKKLRKLILHSKLAPCYPGDDESGHDLEECPICFLYYPSLNRSRCCTKGICTECFLQMRTPNSTRPTQCPFCKTLNYAVEYRGVRTKEEKSLEKIEEQRVIEAKMRIRKQELQNEEERMLKRSEISYSHSMRRPSDVDCCSIAAERSTSSAIQGEEVVTSDESQVALAVTPPSCSGQHREDVVDVDLEDIMVMEAIWLSIKEKGVEEHDPRNTAQSSSSSSSRSLAHAIAMIVDHQQEGRETSNDYGENSSAYNVPEQEPGHYVPAGSSIGALTDSHRSTETEVTEVGTGCADCDDFDDSVSPVERPEPPYSLLKRL